MKKQKKILSILTTLAMMCSIFASSLNISYANDTDVIKDPGLKKAIKEIFKIRKDDIRSKDDYIISKNDLLELEQLKVSSEYIVNDKLDITGLSGAQNLEILKINEPNSIGSIKSITLTPIDGEKEEEKALSELGNLSKLEELYIGNSKLNSVPITTDTIIFLALPDNNIVHFNSLVGYDNLEKLHLEGNNIGEEELGKLINYLPDTQKITTLALTSNNLKSIERLGTDSTKKKLENLKVIHLEENKIADFSPLKGYNLSNFVAENQTVEVIADKAEIDNTLKDNQGRIIPIQHTDIEYNNGKIKIKNFDKFNNNHKIEVYYNSNDNNPNNNPNHRISGKLEIIIRKYNTIGIDYSNPDVEITTNPKDKAQTGQEVTVNVQIKNNNKELEKIIISNPYETLIEIPAEKDKNSYTFKMPNEEIAIKAILKDKTAPPVEKKLNSISLNAVGNKNLLTTTGEMLKINVEFTPQDATNKKIKSWSSSNQNVATVDADGVVKAVASGKTTITAIAEDGDKQATIEITVQIPKSPQKGTEKITGGGGGGGGTTPTKRDINSPSNVKNGKVEIDKKKAQTGEKVTITVTPDKGYKVKSVKVKDQKGKELSTTINKDKTYSFEMPASQVSIEVEFVKEEMKQEPKKEEKKSEPKLKVKLKIGSQKMIKTENGKEIEVKVDVAPFIRDSRTMMPVRYAAETLGIEVKWDKQTRTVIMTDKDKKILIPIDTNKIIVDGKEYLSDVKPVIENSRTYLSISNLAKALGLEEGKDISWNQETKEVTITRDNM